MKNISYFCHNKLLKHRPKTPLCEDTCLIVNSHQLRLTCRMESSERKWLIYEKKETDWFSQYARVALNPIETASQTYSRLPMDLCVQFIILLLIKISTAKQNLFQSIQLYYIASIIAFDTLWFLLVFYCNYMVSFSLIYFISQRWKIITFCFCCNKILLSKLH